MDTRQNVERSRANGSGMFSPATRRPLRRSLSRNGKAHAACGSSLSAPSTAKTRKPHAACGCALLLLALPLSALAAEQGGSQMITLDVAGGGLLGGVCTALVMWLNNQRKQQRNPPLGEDVARTYVTKTELLDCRGVCRKDIDGLRELIEEKDKSNEERIIGTHKRIDQVYKSLNKNNRSLGIIIGALFAQGRIPASALMENEEEV